MGSSPSALSLVIERCTEAVLSWWSRARSRGFKGFSATAFSKTMARMDLEDMVGRCTSDDWDYNTHLAKSQVFFCKFSCGPLRCLGAPKGGAPGGRGDAKYFAAQSEQGSGTQLAMRVALTVLASWHVPCPRAGGGVCSRAPDSTCAPHAARSKRRASEPARSRTLHTRAWPARYTRPKPLRANDLRPRSRFAPQSSVPNRTPKQGPCRG